MRAIFLPQLDIQDEYLLRDEPLHHLVNVVRISANEELLLLNGKGLKVTAVVEEVSKKVLKLKKISATAVERSYVLDLALGMPKREALELTLKQVTEMGFSKIYLIRSDYSQMKAPEVERMQKLLISALEQSNGGFLPEIVESSWEEVPYQKYQSAIVFDSRPNKQSLEISGESQNLLIVGPEGGFSPQEEAFFGEVPNLKIVNLPTPILRTPTAVAVGAGIVIRGLLK